MAVLAAAVGWQLLVPLEPLELFRSVLAATVLLVGGFGVMLWAWWQFRIHAVAICPTEDTSRLITDGIYRMSRNPMYLGMVMMLFGVAMFIGTLPFYAAAIAYFVVIDRSFCPYEENKLVRAFGERYGEYRSSVRRWI
jgi:protein-S-isoprenylcysteine O-methyltransferase Ste14